MLEHERGRRQEEMRVRSEDKPVFPDYYKVPEVAHIFRMSQDWVRRQVRDDPDVMAIPGPSGKYVTYRIPEAVVERLRRRFSNP
jgi:hypothetical protein